MASYIITGVKPIVGANSLVEPRLILGVEKLSVTLAD